MKQQVAFAYEQTPYGGQHLIQRKTLAPGLGDSYQYPQASKQYAGHSAGIHAEDQDVEESEEYYVTRPHTSARRYTTKSTGQTRQGVRVQHHYHDEPLVKRTSRQHQRAPQRTERDDEEEQPPHPKPRKRIHWVLIFGVGMIAMLALWTGLSMAGRWWQVHQDDATYGRPRTFQMDAIVGHNDSALAPSHFIALNLNRHVVIIELPGGDSAKAKIYTVTTLFGDGQDLTPVTLRFKDVNGDGLLDMEIRIQDQTIALINDNGGFRPPKQGEQIHL